MPEENVEKICNIINQYYKDYGKPVKDWARETGYISIKKLEKLTPEYTDVTTIITQLQSDILNFVNAIYIDPEKTPGKIYDNVINQLGWPKPQYKKDTVFFQFLKNHKPNRNHKYNWAEIANDFHRTLEKNITDLECEIKKIINNLDWDDEYLDFDNILDKLESVLSKDLFEFINNLIQNKTGREITDSDIKKIRFLSKDLDECKTSEKENKKKDLIDLLNNLKLEGNLSKVVDALDVTLKESEKKLDYFYKNIYQDLKDRLGKKIFASDIVKVILKCQKLDVYKSIQNMIDNVESPDWITSFWNGTGIELERGYKSDSFQKVRENNNDIIDVFENTCVQTITSYFKDNIDYKDYISWVNITAKDEKIPADITKTDANYLDWQLVYDNILYFVCYSKKDSNLQKRALQNFAKKYLENLISLFKDQESEEAENEKSTKKPVLEIKKDFVGYYCETLYKHLSKTKDKTVDEFNSVYVKAKDRYYERQDKIITPFLSSLFKYVLFTSSGRYNCLKKSYENIEFFLKNAVLLSTPTTLSWKKDITLSAKVFSNVDSDCTFYFDYTSQDETSYKVKLYSGDKESFSEGEINGAESKDGVFILSAPNGTFSYSPSPEEIKLLVKNGLVVHVDGIKMNKISIKVDEPKINKIWSSDITFSADVFSDVDSDCTFYFDYTIENQTCKKIGICSIDRKPFFEGKYYEGKIKSVENKNKDGVFIPSDTKGTFSFSPSSREFKLLVTEGLIIHGDGITLNKISIKVEESKIMKKLNEKYNKILGEKYNDFSLSSICVRKEYESKFDAYFSDESDTNKPVFIYDISKCLLDEYENKNDFSKNYKAEICQVYSFGSRKKNIINEKYNELFTKTNITTIDKLRMLFICLDDFPTTINNIFKYEYLSEKDYEYFSKTGNYDVLDFIDRVYEKCGKDNQGKILRKIKLDDYKPNGQYFSQTIKYLKLPRSFFTEEKSYDILGASGCSRILENCDNLINYTLAMQYNPLFSKDKKAERIYELICCYPSVYKDFISSVQK